MNNKPSQPEGIELIFTKKFMTVGLGSFLLALSLFSSLVYGSASLEIEARVIVYRVNSGDSFEAFPLGKIVLADVIAPDSGNESRKTLEKLVSLVNNTEVFLDVDDGSYATDSTTGTVSLVYVRINSTHLKNINQALLEEGLVSIDNQLNEFNPDTWDLFVYCPKVEIENNFKQQLLDFYLQQQVIHSAALFAASIATFSFIRGFIKITKEVNAKKTKILFIVVSGILLSLTFNTVFSIVYYGYMASGVVHFPISDERYFNLIGYTRDIKEFLFEKTLITPFGTQPLTYFDQNPLRPLVPIFGRPPSGYAISGLLGFLSSLILSWAFKVIQEPKTILKKFFRLFLNFRKKRREHAK